MPTSYPKPEPEYLHVPKDLTHAPQVAAFLEKALNLPPGRRRDRLARQIAQQETLCREFPTGASEDGHSRHWFRDQRFLIGWERLGLHSKIVEQLLKQRRPAKDSLLRLGPKGGGALPPGGARKDNQAFLLVGSPGCGKSTVARRLFQHERAVVVDADDAKRLLPEYKRAPAQALHNESKRIVEGAEGLLDCVLDCDFNFIYPIVGAYTETLRDAFLRLSRHSAVHLVLVQCPVRLAVERVIKRFEDEGRYVPLRFVGHDVGNRPAQSFHRMYRKLDWASTAVVDTSGPEPRVVYSSDYASYARYLSGV